MIFSIITLFFSTFLMANPSLRWMNAIDVVEKHEFYQDNQVVVKPKETWQTLFGVLYGDGRGVIRKDCLFFRIPGTVPGFLKIKTINRNETCDSYIFENSLEIRDNIKALQFAITEDKITVSMTFPAYKVEKWDIPRLNIKKLSRPENQMSSAEYRSGAIVYLASGMIPTAKNQNSKQLEKIKLCHDIADDCQEMSPSVCRDCPQGWYEIPNGCSQGPKYCGQQECGKKGQPACRRGMQWQRSKREFDCRMDNSFAYCAKGLQVQCEGSHASCL